MFKSLVQQPKWIVVAFGLITFWLAQQEWLTGTYIWQKAEGTLVDAGYRLRGETGADPRIQIIGLNTSSFQLDTLGQEEIGASATLQKMQQPWPWDRSVYAAILEKLMGAGAKVVIFDFVFASETEGDEVLSKALLKYKDRVIIGEMFADEQGIISSTETSTSKKLITPNERLLLPGAESVAGLVTLWPDSDEVVRRARYETSVERETAEQSGIDGRIAGLLRQEIETGKAPDNLVHVTHLAAKAFEGRVVAPPPDLKAYIDYQGPRGTYRAWPVENMFVERLWERPPFRDGLGVSNKIVIVGPMAEIFHDVHSTPFGEMPGPEIQAQMLGALLHGRWLGENSPAANFGLSLGAMVLAVLICLKIPQASLKGLLLIAATAALIGGGQLEFTYGRRVIAMLPPVFCLLTTGAFGILFEYTLEQFERRRYRNVLDRYVSKNVARVILEDRRSFVESLKGRKQPVTVLFSDIRGFTSMTESADADKLVAQLNEYFLDMVGSVLRNAGTLQKFIGDAIMAVWGDTHSVGAAEDAKRAVTTALEMRAALRELNGQWKGNPDRARFSIGIGLNHGEVIVGSIGHPQRREFTVLGDGVNLAARLESATKQFHTDILIGEQVERLTREQFVFRTVDLLTVKGKSKPVEVFALLSDRSLPAPAWLETYHAAIRRYRAREFGEAADHFRLAREQMSGHDFLCDMYISRCDAYRLAPPPPEWDGSFVLAEK